MVSSSARKFASIIASTSAVVPTFRYVEISARFVAGVDDRPLQRGLEADLDLEEVRALADLETRRTSVLTATDSTGTRDDLARDEERYEMTYEACEGSVAAAEIVLVRAIAGSLVVGVVLVEVDRRVDARHRRDAADRFEHDELAGFVPAHGVERIGDLRAGVLRMRMVDVQARAVGQDDVGHPGVLFGLDELLGHGATAAEVEAPGVTQRRLLLEVPAGASGAPGR
jgi:hypothetical protein